MKYSFVEGRENESPRAPAPAVVAAQPPASSPSAIAQPPAPVVTAPTPPTLPRAVAPRAPLAMKVAVRRRDASIVQSPPAHTLVAKNAPSDLAETMNNAAVRALLKATVAAMELHELVDPPAATSATKDDP